MKRERPWRPESGARAVPTGWLAVVVPFTEGPGEEEQFWGTRSRI